MGDERRQGDGQAMAVAAGDTGKTLWVVAVMAFWISAAATVTFTVLRGKLDFILLSITLGLMILGVCLKIRHQLQRRRAAGESSGRGSA